MQTEQNEAPAPEISGPIEFLVVTADSSDQRNPYSTFGVHATDIDVATNEAIDHVTRQFPDQWVVAVIELEHLPAIQLADAERIADEQQIAVLTDAEASREQMRRNREREV